MNIREMNNQRAWNDFLLRVNPNTFLHAWEWGQVQRRAGEEVLYLGVFERNTLVGVCLAITVKARRGRHLLVPHGPIFRTEAETRKYLPALAGYLEGIARVSEQWPLVALRVSPLLEATYTNVQLFRRLGFSDAPMHVHAEITWVLDIDKPEEEILTDMRKTSRHAIKKAQDSGVTTLTAPGTPAVDDFMPLYEKTKQRHDFVPYSRKMIESQVDIFNESGRPDVGAYLVFAQYQGKDVAGGIFFQFGKTVFYYHGASMKVAGADGAAQLLQWEAIKEAKRRGATRFNFWGIAPDSAPGAESGKKHPFAGITTF
ncbi:MAG: peptidoglycan bridge formation glycyltransferase FemA/FemB family protein, partial [Patescibacteria group bacterium]